MAESRANITGLLSRAANGDGSAADELLPLVYEELRRLASAYFASERADHTLQPTAVVHEAYLRLVGTPDASWSDRAHFFRTAALVVRRILVNHARDRGRLKRGGGQRGVALPDNAAEDHGIDLSLDFMALEEALVELGEVDPRKEQVVQLRFFGGFSVEETAKMLDLSPAQVKREWTTARAFLLSRMDESGDGS